MSLTADPTRVGGGAYVVSVSGEADMYTAPRLRGELVEAIGSGAEKVLVDMTDVSFVDSTVLGLLVQANRRLRAAGGRLAVACDDANVVRVIQLTALDRLFRLYPSRELALAGLGAVVLTADRAEQLIDALSSRTSLRRDEARTLVDDLTQRWRGDAVRMSERAGAGMSGMLRELGVVTRAEWDELELRVAQLEHRLRLVEDEPAPPRAVPGPAS